MENLNKNTDTRSKPMQTPDKSGKLWHKIRDIAAVTLLSVTSALGGGCTDKNAANKKAAIERCYDPSHRQRYPFHQNIFVALAVHMVLDPSGSSSVDENGVRENIDDLRRVYKDIIRDFYVARVRRVSDRSLTPGSIPGESRASYESRLKEYMDLYGTGDAVDVMYVPGDPGLSGTYLTTPGGEEFLVLYTDDSGKTYLKKTAAHEFGHLLELKHPFAPGGDGLADTVNYSEACTSTHSVITFMSGDECFAACSDGSYAAPVNLMDYNICTGDMGQTIQTQEGLTYDQLSFTNCVLQSAKPYYINPDLPEVAF